MYRPLRQKSCLYVRLPRCWIPCCEVHVYSMFRSVATIYLRQISIKCYWVNDCLRPTWSWSTSAHHYIAQVRSALPFLASGIICQEPEHFGIIGRKMTSLLFMSLWVNVWDLTLSCWARTWGCWARGPELVDFRVTHEDRLAVLWHVEGSLLL